MVPLLERRNPCFLGRKEDWLVKFTKKSVGEAQGFPSERLSHPCVGCRKGLRLLHSSETSELVRDSLAFLKSEQGEVLDIFKIMIFTSQWFGEKISAKQQGTAPVC